jgi:mannose-6-phosphate isomerase-like protein (cupin superfamily)
VARLRGHWFGEKSVDETCSRITTPSSQETQMKPVIAPLLAVLVLCVQDLAAGASAAEDGVAMRHAAEVNLRAWVVEKSTDFGVVLFEVRSTVPLHLHPDGNRRMFVVEGELEMLGDTETMHMKAGDYMYLPRNHHHKVRLAPGSERALFVTVDNPPVSSRSVVWIEPAPRITYDQSQLERAVATSVGCNR